MKNYATIDQVKKGLITSKSHTDNVVSSAMSTVRAAMSNMVTDENYVHTDNNYTTDEKNKLAGLSNYDDDALSARVSTVEGLIDSHSVGKDVPSDAVFTDTVYDDTALAERMTAAESSIEALEAGTYDDTALRGRVTVVEDLLDGHSVGKDVPADALFTDTVYDDTSLAGRVAAAESAIDNLEASAYDDTALSARVTANETAISTLNGTGAGSVQKAVSDAIDAVVDGAPNTFDTFKEIADWIEDDQTGAAAMAADLANKVNKINGKSLSTNDYTTEEKTKLAGLSNYDDTALAARMSAAESAIETLETSGYDDTAISGRITTVEGLLDGHSVGKDVPADAVFTDTVYNDTALAGRVTTLEGAGYQTSTDVSNAISRAIAGKADTADLAAVATSGSYNDLTDTPNEYELPTASDTTLGGIKVDSTSGATVENGVLKVSAAGGGAIPAYIVGDTMTQGWLSLEENGSALTPVDKQEYVIMSSGEWLRKHVMWMGDISVYRLTGKVGVVNGASTRTIITNRDTETVTFSKTENPYTVNNFEAGRIVVKHNPTIHISARLDSNALANGMALVIRKDGVDLRVVNKTEGGDRKPAILDEDINVTDDDYGSIITVHGRSLGSGGNATVSGTIVQDYIEVFNDYETDDVIDITEEEIEEIFNSTYGEALPSNNVFSTEERAWGVWIDGKTIYRKVIPFGNLPNNTTKQVAHGISNMERFIRGELAIDSGTYAATIMFAGNVGTRMYINRDNVTVITDANNSDYTGFAILYYTKTT